MNVSRRSMAIAGFLLVLSLFRSPGPVAATPAERSSAEPHLTTATGAGRGLLQAPPQPDFGDAPDSSNTLGLNNTAYADTGTLGQFPTVWQGTPAGQPAGPVHFDASLVFLGDTVTFEARADSGADADGVNNILNGGADNADNDGGDDGWLNPAVPFPHCDRTTLLVRVSRAAAAANVGQMYLNVWFDGNRDGDWQDGLNCPGVEVQPLAAEWIVRNFVVDATQIAAGGFQDISVNTFRIPNAAPAKSHWLRFTLSENQLPPVGGQPPDGRGPHPPNGHTYGETEDYLQPPPVAGQPGSLILNKSVSATTPVSPGETVSYTIELEHAGGSAPALTEIKDMLPTGVAFLGPLNVQTLGPGAVPQVARFKKGTVGWRGLIAPGGKLSISFPVRVLPCPSANPLTITNVATATQTDNSPIQAPTAFEVDCASGPLLSKVQASAGFMTDGNLAQTASIMPGQEIPLHLEFTNHNSSQLIIVVGIIPPQEVTIGPADPASDYLTINLGPGETKPIEQLLRLTEEVEDGTELNISLTYCLVAGEEYFARCGSVGGLSAPARPEQELPPLTLVVRHRDLGDAPDNSNHPAAAMTAYPGTPANFPTVRDTTTGTPPGPAHIAPKPFHLGWRVSLEAEADVGPDQDPTHNIRPVANIPNRDRADDGIRPQLLNFNHCQPSMFPAKVFIHPLAVAYFANLDDDGKAYLNVWLDANRDGDWADAVNCPLPPGAQAEAPEHIVIDQAVEVAVLGAGLHTVNLVTGLVPWPADLAERPAWLRVTLSDRPAEKLAGRPYGDGRGAPNPYRMGETEDYLLNGPAEEPELELTGQVLPALTAGANGLSGQALSSSWFARWSWGVKNGEKLNQASPPFQVEVEISDSFADIMFDDQAAAGIQVQQNGNKIIYTIDPALADLADLEEVKILVEMPADSGLSHPAALAGQAATDLAGVFQATARARVIVAGEIKTTLEAITEVGPAAPVIAFATPNGPKRQGGVTCSNPVEVIGLAVPGATVKVWDDTDIVHSTTAGPNGQWSGAINLPAGPHHLHAIQEVNGRPSPSSNIIAILIGLLTAQPDPASLTFTGSTGRLWLPVNPEGDDLLVYLENNETYTVSVARCGGDPNTQMIFGGPLIGTVVLTDPDGDGLYEGTFTYDAARNKADVQEASATPFTLATVGSHTEFVIEGQLLPVDEHKGMVQDAVTGQPLANSTVTIMSPRDTASGLPTGKRFFDIWPGDLFGQPNPQTTDAGGSFFFPLSPGFYQLDVFREGYQSYRQAFNQAETLSSSVFKLTPLIPAAAPQTIWIDQAELSSPFLVIPPGTVVEWVNLDLNGHTVSTGPAQGSLTTFSNGDWDSGLIGPGQSYQQRFDTPGTYTYVDQTNPANVAVIVVEESRLYLPIIVK